MMPNNLRQVPVMEYIRTLEERIRKYQREQGRIDKMVFWWGFLAGGIVLSILWFVIRLKG